MPDSIRQDWCSVSTNTLPACRDRGCSHSRRSGAALPTRDCVSLLPFPGVARRYFRADAAGPKWRNYIPNERLAPEPESYFWLFRAMGTLHHALASLAVLVPQPVGAPYAPPGSVRRWLPVTEAAVQGDAEAAEIAQLVRDLTRCLRRHWIPAAALPVHLIHGDVRLSNVRQTPTGEAVYFDCGFLARRPLFTTSPMRSRSWFGRWMRSPRQSDFPGTWFHTWSRRTRPPQPLA